MWLARWQQLSTSQKTKRVSFWLLVGEINTAAGHQVD